MDAAGLLRRKAVQDVGNGSVDIPMAPSGKGSPQRTRAIDAQHRNGKHESDTGGPLILRWAVRGFDWCRVMIPDLAAMSWMLALIFGGCCSNVGPPLRVFAYLSARGCRGLD